MDEQLAKEDFWINYWQNLKLPVKVDYDFKNDRVIAETIKKYIKNTDKSKIATEIGCAPGKWLDFIHKNLNYKIVGYEFLDVVIDKTITNLLLNGIPSEDFVVRKLDFLKETITDKYDLVLSLGFIEHFAECEHVFNKHVDLMADDAYFVLGMPNFKCINYFLQFCIDIYNFKENKILNTHNLSIMNLSLLKKLANKKQLDILFIDYVGGFEPALFGLNKVDNKFIKFILRVFINFFSLFFSKLNNKFCCGYILAIMRKRNIYAKNFNNNSNF